MDTHIIHRLRKLPCYHLKAGHSSYTVWVTMRPPFFRMTKEHPVDGFQRKIFFWTKTSSTLYLIDWTTNVSPHSSLDSRRNNLANHYPALMMHGMGMSSAPGRLTYSEWRADRPGQPGPALCRPKRGGGRGKNSCTFWYFSISTSGEGAPHVVISDRIKVKNNWVFARWVKD